MNSVDHYISTRYILSQSKYLLNIYTTGPTLDDMEININIKHDS